MLSNIGYPSFDLNSLSLLSNDSSSIHNFLPSTPVIWILGWIELSSSKINTIITKHVLLRLFDLKVWKTALFWHTQLLYVYWKRRIVHIFLFKQSLSFQLIFNLVHFINHLPWINFPASVAIVFTEIPNVIILGCPWALCFSTFGIWSKIWKSTITVLILIVFL